MTSIGFSKSGKILAIIEQAVELRRQMYDIASKFLYHAAANNMIAANFHDMAQKLADQAYWSFLENSSEEFRIRFSSPKLANGQFAFEWHNKSKEIKQIHGPSSNPTKEQLENWVVSDGWIKTIC